MLYRCIPILIIIAIVPSCKLDYSDQQAQSDIVVTVDNKVLYANELKNIIHPSANTKDSTALANAYVDQWVRDQLLMKEASRYFSSDFEIERLVDDYREKLIKFNFENKIINERFDTIVTQKELERFYDINKERFVLNQPVLRCIYAKIPKGERDIAKFKKQWTKDSELSAILSYIDKHADQMNLDENRWHAWSEISSWYPRWSISRAKNKTHQQQSDEEYEYFLKVLEYRDEKEISPLPFISDQLTQMILHQRKQDIIEKYKSELYNQALENNQIKIMES